jgi:hypothetical protein
MPLMISYLRPELLYVVYARPPVSVVVGHPVRTALSGLLRLEGKPWSRRPVP